MSERNQKALQVMISTASHLSLSVVRDDNFDTWIEVLREVHPNCVNVQDVVRPLRDAVGVLLSSEGASARQTALFYLGREVKAYHVGASAAHFDAWKKLSGRGDRS